MSRRGDLYGYSIMATQNKILTIDIQHIPGIVRSVSQEAAEAYALTQAIKTFPKEDGWMNHHANVFLIPSSILDEAG